MNYALVQNEQIVQSGVLPPVWNDGQRDWDLRPMSDEQLAELGWLPITETTQPANTPTTTFESSVELVNGVPTQVWTERPLTEPELVTIESQTNTDQLVSESGESVDKLVQVVEDLNLITDLTNSTINANPAAIIKDVARLVKTVARQANREARLTSGKTDDTNTGSGPDL